MLGTKVQNLCKSYRVGVRLVPVLQNLSLTLPPTGITVVLGRSGCGKTTLLRLLAGLEQADSGEILRGDDARVGMVFQEPRLMPWLTTKQNIAFALQKQESAEATLRSLVELTGLGGFENAYPAQLSGGMQQRAALARVLAYDPGIILMDEPFAALDYFTRGAMQEELLRICRASGKAVLFVTHSVEEALLIGNEIIILEHGAVEKNYSLASFPIPRDLYSAPLLALKKEILQQFQT